MKKFIISILMLMGALQLTAMEGSEEHKLKNAVARYMKDQDYQPICQLADAFTLRAYALAQSGDDGHYIEYLARMRSITGAFITANAQSKNELQKSPRFLAAYSTIVQCFAHYAQEFQQKPYHEELFRQTLVLKKLQLQMTLVPQEIYNGFSESARKHYTTSVSGIRLDILQALYCLHKHDDIISLWSADKQLYLTIARLHNEVYFLIGASYFKNGNYPEASNMLAAGYLKFPEAVKPLLRYLVSTIEDRNSMLNLRRSLQEAQIDETFKNCMLENCENQLRQTPVLRREARERVRQERTSTMLQEID